jgi:hypothetical protein
VSSWAAPGGCEVVLGAEVISLSAARLGEALVVAFQQAPDTGRADTERFFQLAGDWNGDGRDTPGVVPGTSSALRNSNSTGSAGLVVPFATL